MCYKTARGIVPPHVQALTTECVGNQPGHEMGSSHLQTFITVSVYNSQDAHRRPLQILLYGSGDHYVGQLVGEPHAETGEEG